MAWSKVVYETKNQRHEDVLDGLALRNGERVDVKYPDGWVDVGVMVFLNNESRASFIAVETHGVPCVIALSSCPTMLVRRHQPVCTECGTRVKYADTMCEQCESRSSNPTV